MKFLITGGFGFIGSSLIKYLNNIGHTNIDVYAHNSAFEPRWRALLDLDYNAVIYEEDFDNINIYSYDSIIHLGANASTTQEENTYNWNNNISFSLKLINKANNSVKKPSIIFASSAAVYGNQTSDFSEGAIVKPNNFYGFTKLKVEKEIQKMNCNSNIYSLRFFNVYGARERHKGNMASPIHRCMDAEKVIFIFKSPNPNIKNSDMKRDFVHVSDVCSVIYHCSLNNNNGGVYNVGSGVASNWEEVASTIFDVKGIKNGLIKYQKMPPNIAEHYQYFTCANLDNLRNKLKYDKKFLTLKEGIALTYQKMKDIYGDV